jgi:hypothetical protein
MYKKYKSGSVGKKIFVIDHDFTNDEKHREGMKWEVLPCVCVCERARACIFVHICLFRRVE